MDQHPSSANPPANQPDKPPTVAPSDEVTDIALDDASDDATGSIHMQPHGHLAPSGVTGCFLAVVLRDAPSKRERRHFFNDMRRAMRSQGIAMSQRYGLCFVVPVDQPAVATDRHAAVDWLVDQPQTRAVSINWIRPVTNYLTKPLDIVFEDDQPVAPQERAGAERLVRCLVIWALIERVHAAKAMRRRAGISTSNSNSTSTSTSEEDGPDPPPAFGQGTPDESNAKEE